MTPCGCGSWQKNVLLSTLHAGSLSIDKNAIFGFITRFRLLIELKIIDPFLLVLKQFSSWKLPS